MSIEGIALEHFSRLPKIDTNSTTPSHQRHAVFHSFLSDNSKQDAATITACRKRFISFLKEEKIINNIIEYNMGKNYGCAEKYICASALYLISFMSQFYSIIIDQGISALGDRFIALLFI